MMLDVDDGPPTPTAPPAVAFGEGRRPEAATHVRLADFEGPLGLLLALIEARQLDVLTVPLGALAEAYLEALASLEDDRLGNVSAFVAVASQLILIKSRAMLPRRRSSRRAARWPRTSPIPRRSCGRGSSSTGRYRDAGRRAPGEALGSRSGCSGASRRRPRRRRSPAPDPPTRRRSTPRSSCGALGGLAQVAPPPALPPEVMPRTITLTERADDHPRGAPRRAGRRPAGPAGRRPRPGRRRGHVPRDAGADEAARDRRRAGGAVGADRAPGDDGRGARARWPRDVEQAPLDESLESFA